MYIGIKNNHLTFKNYFQIDEKIGKVIYDENKYNKIKKSILEFLFELDPNSFPVIEANVYINKTSLKDFDVYNLYIEMEIDIVIKNCRHFTDFDVECINNLMHAAKLEFTREVSGLSPIK